MPSIWLRYGLPTALAAIAMLALPAASMADESQSLGLAAALENALVTAIEEAEPSVVSIARDRLPPRRGREIDDDQHVPGMEPAVTQPNYVPNEFGSGVIVHEAGLILTNYHVVRGGPIEGHAPTGDQVLYVRLIDGRGFFARIYAADPRSDLAVIKIDAQGLRPIRFGNAGHLKKGQIVITLGNPYAIARDGSASASWGIISGISRSAAQEGSPTNPETMRRTMIHHFGTLLQIDARLNLGTSGGPVLNLKGEMIGLSTSLAAVVGFEKSAGFAIPLDPPILRIVDSLIHGQEVEYGFLGIHLRELTDLERRIVDERFHQHGGAAAQEVFLNSPAAGGGLQNEDVILGLNGKAILSMKQFRRDVGLLAPRDVAHLRIWRRTDGEEGAERQLNIVVGKWPVADDEGIVASQRRNEPWRGLSVDYGTARDRYGMSGIEVRIPVGVLILEVQPGSPAAKAQLQAGEFITQVKSQPVRDPKQFYDTVRGLTGTVRVLLSSGRQVDIPAP